MAAHTNRNAATSGYKKDAGLKSTGGGIPGRSVWITWWSSVNTSSETAKELFHLLPPFADPSGVGKGRSRSESNHESRRDRRHPSSRQLAPPGLKTRRVRTEDIRLTLNRSAIVGKPK